MIARRWNQVFLTNKRGLRYKLLPQPSTTRLQQTQQVHIHHGQQVCCIYPATQRSHTWRKNGGNARGQIEVSFLLHRKPLIRNFLYGAVALRAVALKLSCGRVHPISKSRIRIIFRGKPFMISTFTTQSEFALRALL